MNWLRQQAANIAGTQEPIYGPDAVQPVGKAPSAPAYTEATRDDLKWVAPNYTCVETQTFYLFAKSGHIVFVQVIYNNIAGLRVTCQFNTKVFYPESGKPQLWSSDPLYNHGFSEDHTGFHADGCSIELNKDATELHVKSTTNKQSVVDLKITRIAPGFQVGKRGETTFGTDPNAPWGSMRHVFWPRCEGAGDIMTKEGPISFAGSQAMFIHALQGMKPHHAAARWNFLNFQSPTYTAIMMEFTTPASYGYTTVNVGGIVKGDEILYAGITNEAKHTEVAKDSDNDWPEPVSAHYKWTGKTADGKNLTAELVGKIGPRQDRVDVMAEVPGFIKTFAAATAGTKPYIYQYIPREHLKLKVTVDGKTQEEEGMVFAEATFISE